MAIRVSRDEARAFGAKILPAPRVRKFRNRPERRDEIWFDSQLELRRYCYLKQVEMAGALTDLKVHPEFELFASGSAVAGTLGSQPVSVGVYIADFSYHDDRGWMVEDTKGVVLPLYALKRRIFRANYPELIFMEVRQWRKRWVSQLIKA
jgi:hypothetical protein